MELDLRTPWSIGGVEIPTRLVLAPMAGVSVQAFRRQGRRYGAGLVCSEMVSCAGIEHRNEKTLGYLRVASDEHPLAIQIFGSDPLVMAEAARMVAAAGADIVDVNFGCPVKKVTKTGAGATLLDDPDRACRIVEAIADAVSLPVTVKMRRGLENGSRACLEVGPRLVEAGAASLTLHPRSAKQMYTGEADHSLTAELVGLVDVPVIASGDITSRARAQAVLATTGTSTSETSSAVNEWSASPVYICFAERGCRVSVEAPASTSRGPTSRHTRDPFSRPRRIFTEMGTETASAIASTIRHARPGSSSSVAPAPVFVTFLTGQPKLTSTRSAPAASTIRAASAITAGSAPKIWIASGCSSAPTLR
jgi:tRNA-dihydrouridine synthase